MLDASNTLTRSRINPYPESNGSISRLMRIRWTEPAARDLSTICDFTYEHDGPEAARRIEQPLPRGHKL